MVSSVISFITHETGDLVLSFLSALSTVVCGLGSVVISIVVFVTGKCSRRKYVPATGPRRTFGKDEPEVIIIGSGVAGSAMATVLARDGRRVTVIERDMKEPNRVVGEILQPGGVQALDKLGLSECIDGIDAHTIKGYVLHNMEDKTEVIVPYSKHEETLRADATCASAFHNGRFVNALREKALKEPNVTYIEGTAIKLLEENSVVVGVQYRPKDSDECLEVHAPLTFVVDGCFSKFRKELVNEKVTVTSHAVCLLMNDCPQRIKNYAEVIATRNGPVMIYQISSDNTRAFVDVRGVLPRNLKEYLLDTVCPQLPERIQEPFKDSVHNGRIKSMPNSFLPPNPLQRPGVLVLGDAYNMRHPLTGGGMSVCLNDIVIWREMLQGIPDLSDYEDILKKLRVFHLKRKSTHSFVVNVLANSWYELLAANNKHMDVVKKAGFAYLGRGGKCVEDTVSLLTIRKPKPSLFFGYLISLSLYLIYFVLRSEPVWVLHRSIYRSYAVIVAAYGVFFPLLWSEAKNMLLV